MEKLEEMRRRAETIALGSPHNLETLTPEAGQKLMHELLVHQVELDAK